MLKSSTTRRICYARTKVLIDSYHGKVSLRKLNLILLPIPDFNISIVFIPLAANTIALGAVETGSINAKLDREIVKIGDIQINSLIFKFIGNPGKVKKMYSRKFNFKKIWIYILQT